MKLDPYVSVEGIRFTASVADVVARLGRPQCSGRNGIGLHEFDYGTLVCRFQDSGRLEEVTLQAPVLHLGAVAVPFGALGGFVRGHDPEAFERAGFLVSPRYGLAFAPDCPSWVTALAAHCIPTWREL